MKIWQLTGILVLTAAASTAQAMDATLIGGVVGGTAGAVVGHNMNGRTGAIIGGLIGAAAGATIGKAIDRQNNPYAGSSAYGAAYPAYPATRAYPAGVAYPVRAVYPARPVYTDYRHDRGRHLGYYKHGRYCRGHAYDYRRDRD